MAERRGSRFQEQQRKSTRQTGTDYERAAGYYLEQLGYEILEYNYRCRAGEIDLIAKDGEYLVFCEVKYRTVERCVALWRRWARASSGRSSGAPCFIWRSITQRDVPCRFDVIGIEGAEVVHIKNAFAG